MVPDFYVLFFLGCGDSGLQQLQEENQQLRQEIHHLHQLLTLWQPQPCSICKLHSSTAKGADPRTRAVGGSSSPTVLDGTGAYAAVARVLRQQQVLIAQQQRQVVALQVSACRMEVWGSCIRVAELFCSNNTKKVSLHLLLITPHVL